MSQNIPEPQPAQPGDGVAIRFDGVSKSFGETVVLRDFDLACRAGEIVTLIGPSGSGKTTVLRLAMGLETPTAGDIRIHGESTTRRADGTPLSRRDRARIERRCGMVFQQYNLFPHMDVLSNLTLAPRTVLGLSRPESEQRAREYLEMVGLADKIHALPDQLSGGQQQRIAIARALAMRPQVLLLDEITSALDPELVAEVLKVVRQLAEETSIAMLIVTHEMRFAREIADRVIVFDGGSIVEQGDPEQIFSAPSHPRTRSFLQSILSN